MALTSEEVVEHGTQVVDQVNRLAEQMNVFQQRLDGLGETYDELSTHMDEREDEIRQAFDNLGELLKGEAKTQVQSVGETLEESLKTPVIDGIQQFKDTLDTEFNKISTSSEEVVQTWQQWRDTEVSQIMTEMQDNSAQHTEQLNSLIENANEDIELMGTTADTYIEKSSNLLSDLQDNLQQSVEAITSEQEKYGEFMLESYATRLEETLKEAHEILTQTQSEATEEMFNDVTAQFSDLVKSQMIPLIDELVQTVSDAVDQMMEDITSIGDNADDKSQSLDLVTEALEGLISPVKDIIDRTQGIKDTVGAFL